MKTYNPCALQNMNTVPELRFTLTILRKNLKKELKVVTVCVAFVKS